MSTDSFAEGKYKIEDTRLGPWHSTTESIATSKDGCHIAYATVKGEKWLVVVDGQPGPEYDGIMVDSLIFSPDGERVAYAAEKGKKWLVVVDGQPGQEYDGIMEGDPIFSPDGKSVAYVAWQGE